MALKMVNTESKYDTELNYVPERSVKVHEPAIFASTQLLQNRVKRLGLKLSHDNTLFGDICFWGGTHPEVTTVAEQRQYIFDRVANELKCRIEDLALNLSRRGLLFESRGEQYVLDCGMEYPEDPYRIPVSDFDVVQAWGMAGDMERINAYADIAFRVKNTQSDEIKYFRYPIHVGKEIGSCIQPVNIDDRMKQLMGELKNG